MIICGDLNSRVSNKIDFIPEIDQLEPRMSIDTQTNNQPSKHFGVLQTFDRKRLAKIKKLWVQKPFIIESLKEKV